MQQDFVNTDSDTLESHFSLTVCDETQHLDQFNSRVEFTYVWNIFCTVATKIFFLINRCNLSTLIGSHSHAVNRAKLSTARTVNKMRGQTPSSKYPQVEGQLGDCFLKHSQELGEDSDFGN